MPCGPWALLNVICVSVFLQADSGVLDDTATLLI
jgi:hypothetical protein